jgi:hypothetical protein
MVFAVGPARPLRPRRTRGPAVPNARHWRPAQGKPGFEPTQYLRPGILDTPDKLKTQEKSTSAPASGASEGICTPSVAVVLSQLKVSGAELTCPE